MLPYKGGEAMLLWLRAAGEALFQRRKARAAFRDYARNGWQCPWIRKNGFWYSVFHR